MPTPVDSVPRAAIAEREAARPGGAATLEFTQVQNQTILSRSYATSPLRVLSPKNSGRAAWVYTSTFGGGLIAGDQISIELTAKQASTFYLSSQSSTKVYRSVEGETARQNLHATLHEEATAIITPDPIVCFAGARYHQRQIIEMHGTANLVLLDSFTSGRHAPPRSEAWRFSLLRAENQLTINGRRILTDRLHLDPADGPIAERFRFTSARHENIDSGGGLPPCALHYFATLIMVGPRFAAHAQRILQYVHSLSVTRNNPMPLAASPLANGLILRLAAANSEHATQFLCTQLEFLDDVLTEHPWNRKW